MLVDRAVSVQAAFSPSQYRKEMMCRGLKQNSNWCRIRMDSPQGWHKQYFLSHANGADRESKAFALRDHSKRRRRLRLKLLRRHWRS
mmetsp:Transcript_32365/g.67599  ORF Transcript_32365/g.67599 Transcript_32365/m.67599 type:complete len:87 (+) Transcript_32365:115-375(+)